MGCLFELIFDIFLEGTMELTAWCSLKLLQLIFPDKTISDRTRGIIKLVTGSIGVISFFALVVGLIMLFQEGSITRMVGRYITLISLILLLLPIVLYIIVWVIRRFINKKSKT